MIARFVVLPCGVPKRAALGRINPSRSRISHGNQLECFLTQFPWIGHAFRKNAAGAFGPDLSRKLSQLVKMEKNVMRSMELVARERMEVAVC